MDSIKELREKVDKLTLRVEELEAAKSTPPVVEGANGE